MPRKCAFGCKSTGGGSFHVFPNPDKLPEQFEAWVKSVGGRLDSPSDYEYFRSQRVCDLHFEDHHRNRFNRLSALAVPLPIIDNERAASRMELSVEAIRPHGGSVEAVGGVPQPSTSYERAASRMELTVESIGPHGVEAVGGLPQPSTSYERAASRMELSVESIGRHGVEAVGGLPQPSTSFESATSRAVPSARSFKPCGGSVEVITDLPQPTTSSENRARFIIQEHNYCVTSRNVGTKRIKKIYVPRPHKVVLRKLQNQIRRLKKNRASLKSRLENAEKFQTSLEKVTKNMSRPAQIFINMQLQGSKKKAKGRRFTQEEKVMSLSFYKRSPKCYKLLSQTFTLPSAKTLKRLLSQIKLKSGINSVIFEKMKKVTSLMDVEDRLCTLIFDEMSITPNINYDVKNDCLKGFADFGSHTIADHVLVFMVKGIKKNYKQPVAYFFTSNMHKAELKQAIKDVSTHIQESGLIILCTVCDQSTINVSAINELIKETKEEYMRREIEWKTDFFEINKKKIIPIFDVPHLVKGLRNNILTKDMKYRHENKEYLFKWDYIQMLYSVDRTYGELRLAQKLTEEHVVPDKIKKMRVKTATQVFSHSVAVAAEHLTARGDLSQDCKQIIPFTLMIDNLFDSLNCSKYVANNGKIYTGAVRENSPHHRLWLKAKEMLHSVKFIQQRRDGAKVRLMEVTVPSINNFIKTIEGMEALWKILSQKYCINAFLTRNCNQDPIGNFFGNIRSYGVRNVAPNSVMWEGAFKALLLNNYNSPHSLHSNCEEDTNSCLQVLDCFITNSKLGDDTDASDITENINVNMNMLLPPDGDKDLGQRNYVCGWVLTKCLKNIVKKCQECRKALIASVDNEENAFIKAKEYTEKKWLCYPSEQTVKCFHEIQHYTVTFLQTNVEKNNLKYKIKLFIDTFVEFPFKCEEHKVSLQEYFTNTTINVLVFSWCRSINRILDGKIKYDGEDLIKSAAQIYFNKHKHNK